MSANIVAQAVGVASFLLLPNLLSVEDYAIVVYVNILLYYASFTDLGIRNAYGRLAPGMLAKGMEEELISMEDSIQLFWQITTFIFSIVASSIFYYKFGSLLNTLLVGLIINLTPLLSFYINKKVVRGGFLEYKGLSIVQYLSSLVTLPSAYFAAFTGWLCGSILAIFTFFAYVRDKKLYLINVRCNPIAHLKLTYEGLFLAAITMVWGTLLMISRLYAASVFSGKIVAEYGVAYSAFSIISSAVIAICLPVTREIYHLCGKSDVEGMGDVSWFVFRIQIVLVICISFISTVLIDIAPLMFNFFFKKYDFDPYMIKIVLMSAIAMPFLVTSGSVFVGNKMLKRYLFTLLSVLALSWVFLYSTVNIFKDLTPAITQFVFLCMAGISLTVLLWASISSPGLTSFLIFMSPLILCILTLTICVLVKYLSYAVFRTEMIALVCADTFIIVLFAAALLLIKRKISMIEHWKIYYIEKAGLII